MSEREVWIEQLRFEIQSRRSFLLQFYTWLVMFVMAGIPVMVLLGQNLPFQWVLSIQLAWVGVILWLAALLHLRTRDSMTETKNFRKLLDKALMDDLPVDEVRSQYSQIKGQDRKKE